MRHPLADAAATNEPHKTLVRYRLIPSRAVEAGHIAWVEGIKLLAVSKPSGVVVPPSGTDTACLSVGDYRMLTAEIAFAEEKACQ